MKTFIYAIWVIDMAELRRILLSPKRLSTLLLLTLLCLALLIYSFLDGILPNALKNNLEGVKFANSKISQWQELSPGDISALADEEIHRLGDISSWADGYRSEWYGFQSQEEYDKAICGYSYLQTQSGSEQDFRRAINGYQKYLVYIGSLAEYQAGYAEYLSGIQSQAERLAQISIFGDKNSFSNRNILKTAADFTVLEGVSLEFVNGYGLELWLGFAPADFIFVGGIIVIVLGFLEERKKGLWSVVRSCPGGRIGLGISRLLILALGSVLCTLLFSALPLAVSLMLNGKCDFGAALQSLPSFKTCTLNITISQWLCLYFTLKVFSGIAIGLVIWCVLGTVTNPQFSLSVLAGFLVLEYGLYKLLPVQSFANVLKYFNIFSYIHLSSLYTDYLNINLFGQPIGIRGLMLCALPILLILLTVWALCIQAKRYPEGNRDILGALAIRKNAILDIFRTRLTMGGWELYKAFVFGFCAVIVVVIIILGGSLRYNVYIHEPDAWYRAYLKDCEGKITQETEEYFVIARENAGENAELLHALSRLEREVSDTKTRAENGGFEPWIVDEKVYNSYYGEESVDRQRLNGLIAIVFVIFLTAGIGAYEKQSGVTFIVKSTQNGRGSLMARKAATSAVMAAIVWANIYLRELIIFLSEEKPVTLGAAVQNLPSLADFPLKITLGQYIVILYGARLIMLILTGLIVLAIGSLCKNVLMSYIINVGALAFPGLLVVSGVEIMKYASPIIAVSSAEILWNAGGGHMAELIYYAIVSVAVIMIWAIGYIRYKTD